MPSPVRDRQQERDPDQATATSERATCPECDGSLVQNEEHGETVCTDCGLIIAEDTLDRGPEWRAFDASEKDEKSRVGAPTTELLHDKGLSSQISWEDEDAYGNPLTSKQRHKMERLRMWDERFRTRSSTERNLQQALGEIQRMGSALGLPEPVRETAAVIYRRALGENLLQGRSIEGVATAALYAAARQAGTPRSLDEMEQVSRVATLEISRTYRYLIRQLALAITPADPVSYVPRFVSELDATDACERQARDLLATAKEQGLQSGKSPVGLAAAAIYAGGLLTEEDLTQAEVSEAANVTEVTIRNRYQELLDAAGYRRPSA